MQTTLSTPRVRVFQGAANHDLETAETLSRDFPDAWSAALQAYGGSEKNALMAMTEWRSVEGMSYASGLRAKVLNEPAVYTVLLAPLRGGYENCALMLM